MLDILTEQGQKTVEDEKNAVAIWHKHNPNLRYARTSREDERAGARADAVIVSGRGFDLKVEYIAECKCRYNIDLNTFRGKWKSEWLVTYDKILVCIELAKGLSKDVLGMLYLVDEKVLLHEVIWTYKEGWVVPFRVARTQTQKTCNGGKIYRDNAFIDMSNAVEIR